MRIRPYIIAEAGVNHNGDVDLAKRLIEIAKANKADAIKFQTFKTSSLVTKEAAKAKYQKSHQKGSQYAMLKNLELSHSDFLSLWQYANDLNIDFISTAFDSLSLKFLVDNITMPFLKIPSGEITNIPLLELIGSKNSLTLLSTGMSTEIEIKQAIKILLKNGLSLKKLVLMHCVSNYPTKLRDLNLNYIPTMKKKFNCEVGFSDHSMGINASLAAIALGAKIIEKHFTLSRDNYGSDHKISQTPSEFKKMVSRIRQIECDKKEVKKILTSETAKKCLGNNNNTINEEEEVTTL